MALTWTSLLIPNLNVTTIIGIVLIVLALVGGPAFRFIGSILSKISGGEVKSNIIVSLLSLIGIILIWGVSIVQDLLNDKVFVYVLAGVVFFIAIILIMNSGKNK